MQKTLRFFIECELNKCREFIIKTPVLLVFGADCECHPQKQVTYLSLHTLKYILTVTEASP